MTVSSKIEKCIGFDGFKVLFFAAATICKGEELKKGCLFHLQVFTMRLPCRLRISDRNMHKKGRAVSASAFPLTIEYRLSLWI
jgi:hypothetical protein